MAPQNKPIIYIYISLILALGNTKTRYLGSSEPCSEGRTGNKLAISFKSLKITSSPIKGFIIHNYPWLHADQLGGTPPVLVTENNISKRNPVFVAEHQL